MNFKEKTAQAMVCNFAVVVCSRKDVVVTLKTVAVTVMTVDFMESMRGGSIV